ncbi:MAG: hypothetical protein GEV05_19605 [Betaproteobacteria bacterium]|nr:hypothetical protein [Betaproteobacteria bacterium]
MASVSPHVGAGRLKAIGISSRKRSAVAPEVPSLHEAGLPGFEYATWYGMLVPAKTRASLVDSLQRATARVLAASEVAKRIRAARARSPCIRRFPIRRLPARGDRALGADRGFGRDSRSVTRRGPVRFRPYCNRRVRRARSMDISVTMAA